MVLTRHRCRELARRREPNRARSGRTTDAATRARRLRGDLLRARRFRADVARRQGLRDPCGRLHRLQELPRGAHHPRRRRRPRRDRVRAARVPRLRRASTRPDDVVDHGLHRGPERTSLGPRAEARVAGAGSCASGDDRQRAGRRAAGARRPPQTRPRRSGRLTLDRAQAHRNGCRHLVRARRTCTPPKKRSSSCSRATALSS